MPIQYPDPLLEVRVSHVAVDPDLCCLCAGYDGGSWRSKRLAEHLFQWLPYVALSQESQLGFAAHNFVEMLRLAAAHIYKTKKTSSRGELGELLLHIACISEFGTVPVVCKLVLKTSSNDTVKGFDGVHLLRVGGHFNLWLGESKFYTNPKEAISDAVESVKSHILPSFLDTEKAMLFGHVGQDIPFRDEVIKLFKQTTSGDELLKMATFPVLIAYESNSVASHTAVTTAYIEALRTESLALRDYFCGRASGVTLRFHLIFVPMSNKGAVIKEFDALLAPFA